MPTHKLYTFVLNFAQTLTSITSLYLCATRLMSRSAMEIEKNGGINKILYNEKRNSTWFSVWVHKIPLYK